MNLRNLNIYNTWPSVPEDKTVNIKFNEDGITYQYTIPKGNWNAWSLAAYLNTLFAVDGLTTTMAYDSGRLGFIFTDTVEFVDFTDCIEIFGFPSTNLGYQWGSTIPIDISGPSRIHVNSNLSLFTVPQSGRLGTVPVNVDYGELLSYFDESGTEPSLCSDMHLTRLTLHLTDQDNNELEGYDEIPWGAVIAITPIPNDGFEAVGSAIQRPSEEDVPINVE